jgi:LCP family protein required for cell wall assembly
VSAAPSRLPARRRRGPGRAAVAVGVFLVTAVVVGAAGGLQLLDRLGGLRTVDVGGALAADRGDGSLNYLVVGSDSRAGADPSSPDFGSMGDEGNVGGKRSDTIMVLRLGPGGAASLLSLPRDLWVGIAGTDRSQRINTAFGRGADVLVRTVQEHFGIPIDHYLEIDFQGFKALVEALGGVDVWFDQPVRDGNTGLAIGEPGCHRLDGVEALAFARSRKLEYLDGGEWRTDGTGDLGRIGRQQYFIRVALKASIEQASTNPLAIGSLLDVGTGNVTVDQTLSQRDLLSLGVRVRSLDPGNLATYTVTADPQMIDGNAVLVPDLDASSAVLDLFPGHRPADGRTGPRRSAAAGPGAAPVTVGRPGAVTRVLMRRPEQHMGAEGTNQNLDSLRTMARPIHRKLRTIVVQRRLV